MAYENLLYEKREGIAYITFNRPKVLNALNRKTVEELHHARWRPRADLDRGGRKIIRGRSRYRRTGATDAGERQGIFALWPERFSFAGDHGEAVDLRD